MIHSTSIIYNLLTDATECEASRRFSGTIKSVSLNAKQHFTFGITEREIILAAVADLIAKNRRVEGRARLSGSGGIWTAEEIKRLSRLGKNSYGKAK